jgi:hypothetical protein
MKILNVIDFTGYQKLFIASQKNPLGLVLRGLPKIGKAYDHCECICSLSCPKGGFSRFLTVLKIRDQPAQALLSSNEYIYSVIHHCYDRCGIMFFGF